ncbi:hypothetical protein [Agrobacterium rubi]|uniref:hypothetical protein n=1 Tax=Agrobacterium rubi TaxID=28099 RepID=UPI001574B45D|nr:hypothetical protein [Agrobacterium rubi]
MQQRLIVKKPKHASAAHIGSLNGGATVQDDTREIALYSSHDDKTGDESIQSLNHSPDKVSFCQSGGGCAS